MDKAVAFEKFDRILETIILNSTDKRLRLRVCEYITDLFLMALFVVLLGNMFCNRNILYPNMIK